MSNLVLDVNSADSTIIPPYASFLEESVNAAVVTANRSASGKKLTFVNLTGNLFGGTSYLETANAALLNFGAAASFTVALGGLKVQGVPPANQVLIAKKADLGTGAGWAMYVDTNGKLVGIVGDGAASSTVTSVNALTPGQLYLVALVRDGIGKTLSLIINGVVDSTAADATTLTLSNTAVLRVGQLSGAGANNGDFFCADHLLFNQTLTAGQMITLASELLLNTNANLVPVSGVYPLATSTVFSSSVVGETQARYSRRADGAEYGSDGSYAQVRLSFISRTIGGADTLGSERVFYGPSAGLGANLYKNTGMGYNVLRVGGGTCRACTAMGSHSSEFNTVQEVTTYGANSGAANIDCFFLHALGAHAAEGVLHGTSSTHVGDECGSYATTTIHSSLLGFYQMSTYLENLNGATGHSPTVITRTTGMGDYGGSCGDVAVDGNKTDQSNYGYNARHNGNFTNVFGSGTRAGVSGAPADGASAWGTDHTGLAAVSLLQDHQAWGTVLHINDFPGLIKWTTVGNTQTTVGAAGAASALPASPTRYLKVVDSDGTVLVVPAFAAA